MTKFIGSVALAAMIALLSSPAHAVVVQYTITFNDPAGPPTGGMGTLTLNEATVGNLNENAPTAGEGFTGTVDGIPFTINSSSFNQWSINLQNGTFNNLQLVSAANFGVKGIDFLATSGGNSWQIQVTQESPLVSSGTFSIGAPTVITAPVPETATWAMMILGFLGLGFMAYRRTSGTLCLA
jgi:hypothetical protein